MWGKGQGAWSVGGAPKSTHPQAEKVGLTIQSSIVPLDGRPSELDAVSEVKSLSH